MDKVQLSAELTERESPLRTVYDQLKEQRVALRQQIADLVAQELLCIRRIHEVSDQLEAIRIEKRDLDNPPRLMSRDRRRRA